MRQILSKRIQKHYQEFLKVNAQKKMGQQEDLTISVGKKFLLRTSANLSLFLATSITCVCAHSVENNRKAHSEQTSASTSKSSQSKQTSYGEHALTDTDMSGFYIGLSAGAAHTNVKYHATQGALYTIPTTGSVLDIKSDGGGFSGIIGGLIGYGLQLERFYLGVDGYAGYDKANVTTFDNDASSAAYGLWKAQLYHTFFYGFSPRIGYKLAPSILVYVGANIEIGKWFAKVAPDQSISDDVGRAYNGTKYSSATITQEILNQSLQTVIIKKNKVNIGPKIGIDIYITKNIFTRIEYSHMKGPKINLTLETAGNLNVKSDYVLQTFSNTQQRFLMSLAYRF